MKTGAGFLEAKARHWTGGGAPADSAAGLGRIASRAAAGRGGGVSRVRGLPASLLHDVRPMCTLVAGVAVHRRPAARPPDAATRRWDP